MRPITPQPGWLESDTLAALDSGEFVYVDCYTIEPKVGDKLRYCTSQANVSVVPVGELIRALYTTEVLIKGLKVQNNLGVEVDEQEVELIYPMNSQIYQAAITWPQALLQGRLDGAKIRRDRYIARQWATARSAGGANATEWLGGFPMFLGLVSSVNKVGRQSATVQVKSDLILLDIDAPRDLMESNCKNTLGDAGCGIDLATLAVPATMGPSPTRSIIPWTGVDAHFNLGKIHVENSDSVTRVRTISRVDADNLYLAYPLDFEPAEGLAFVAYPGCNRTMDEDLGCPFYWGVDWVEHFKGFPFVPVAETAIG